jgi:hypothetical protein
MENFDCILVPGGGLLPDGALPPWTISRLDRVYALRDRCSRIALLSGGTVHKPPPLDRNGYPVFESRQAADYLVQLGLPPERLLTEICSYDTIGNAYYARLLFADPLDLKQLLVITSEFHMPRTQAIFDWVFSLEPLTIPCAIQFQETPNAGLSGQVLEARLHRENSSLEKLQQTIGQIEDLDELHRWIYTEHRAYTVGKKSDPISKDELSSY